MFLIVLEFEYIIQVPMNFLELKAVFVNFRENTISTLLHISGRTNCR